MEFQLGVKSAKRAKRKSNDQCASTNLTGRHDGNLTPIVRAAPKGASTEEL